MDNDYGGRDMALSKEVVKILCEEYLDEKNEKFMDEYMNTLPYDSDRELVKITCETFTRLLLSITPFKAKEFVEKNCAKVTRKIMSDVNERTMRKYIKEKRTDDT